MAIYHVLQQAGEPGLLLDEVVSRVRDRVPLGYAKRAYRADLEHRRDRHAETSQSPIRRRRVIGDSAAVSDERAIRWVVQLSLKNMMRPQQLSAIRHRDKRYVVGTRPPTLRDGTTIEQHDPDGSVTRKAVAMMEFLRVAVPLLEQTGPTSKPYAVLGIKPMWLATQRLVEAYRNQ